MTTEIEDIERALGVLVTAMIDDDARVVSPEAGRHMASPFRMPDRILTRAEMEMQQLLRQPVWAACRQAVRVLGQRLFDLTGGTDGMRQSLERAAEHDPQRYGRRVAIVDSAWDGIGGDADRWWA